MVQVVTCRTGRLCGLAVLSDSEFPAKLEIRENLEFLFPASEKLENLKGGNASNQGKIRQSDWPKRQHCQSVTFCFTSKQCVHWMIGYGGFLLLEIPP